jgi:hypothetical protein
MFMRFKIDVLKELKNDKLTQKQKNQVIKY